MKLTFIPLCACVMCDSIPSHAQLFVMSLDTSQKVERREPRSVPDAEKVLAWRIWNHLVEHRLSSARELAREVLNIAHHGVKDIKYYIKGIREHDIGSRTRYLGMSWHLLPPADGNKTRIWATLRSST